MRKCTRNHFRWLETADEYLETWGYPGQGRWKISGMYLQDSVLEKIYHKNAERLFEQFKGVKGTSTNTYFLGHGSAIGAGIREAP